MAYTVLARKYRPRGFDALVGQETVAKILQGAIAQDRVAHAFLFTGVRGVGKTTTARILAKCLNCESSDKPVLTPCDRCPSCEAIASGTDLDVLEIDGASNNGVDDIRRLQESIPFRPARGRYKVIIIDEVHMLSSGAFNALLKTLEEPPSHVKFIFATTEAHKVPVTIRSRCQRHDFRLVPQDTIAGRLETILEQEGIEAEKAALMLLAREAAGSMRDGLTLLDQVLADKNGSLDVAQVREALGLARGELLDAAMEALLSRTPIKAFEVVAQLAEFGSDLLHFNKELLRFCRDLVFAAVQRDAGKEMREAFPNASGDEVTRMSQLIDGIPTVELQRCFAGLAKLLEELHRSQEPRLTLEMGLVKLASRTPLVELQTLVALLQSGAPVPGGSVPSGSASGRSKPGGSAQASSNSGNPPSSSRTEATTLPEQAKHAAPTQMHGSNQLKAKPHQASDHQASDRPAPAQPAPAQHVAAQPAPAQHVAAQPAPAQHVAAQVPPSGEAKTPPEVSALPWETLVEAISETHPAVSAVLEHGTPLEVTRERIAIGYPDGSFFTLQAKTKETAQAVRESAQKLFGCLPVFSIVESAAGEKTPNGESSSSIAPSLHATRQIRMEKREERIRASALSHPRVKELLELFPEAKPQVQIRGEH